jgi:hypothetical protein
VGGTHAIAEMFGRQAQRQSLLAGLLCASLNRAQPFEEETMQTNYTKAALTEKLSLGTLIVILTITNVLVFVTLAPYA